MPLTIKMLSSAPEIMTKAELAKALRLNPKTVERKTIRPGNTNGWIPCEKAGRDCRYPKVAVEQAIINRYGGSPV